MATKLTKIFNSRKLYFLSKNEKKYKKIDPAIIAGGKTITSIGKKLIL